MWQPHSNGIAVIRLFGALLSLLICQSLQSQPNAELGPNPSPISQSQSAEGDSIGDEKSHAELTLGLSHHLGYGKLYDPELASAWIHAAAYDGCETAISILEGMQKASIGDVESEQAIPMVQVEQVEPMFAPYFQKTDANTYQFNYALTRKWNTEQALANNPVALYNCYIMGAQLEKIGYLFAHSTRYYRRDALTFENPKLTELIEQWRSHPENYDHADSWMIAFQNDLNTSGFNETSLERLRQAIEGGSLRARLYRLKYLNDTMLSENDSVASNEDEIHDLLQEAYPPAWDLECARLLEELQALESVEDPKPFFEAIQQGVRFGYELNPLRLLGNLMAKSLDQSVYNKGFEIYQKAASMSMPTAYFSLGFCYRNGFGVETDIEKAIFWLQKAEENHDAAASYQLGWILLERNQLEEAFKSFELSAEQGNAKAQLQSGLMLNEGVGVEPNLMDAYRWLEAAAEQGNETASLFCGLYQENGWIGDPDTDQALYYYRKAIISQSEQSYQNFFRFLVERISDKSTSINSMLTVVDEMRHWIPADYLEKLGVLCWEHPDWDPQTRWDRANVYFEAAAAQGSETGKLMMYVLCINGYPGHNTAEAVAFFNSILERPVEETEPRFRARAVSALSIAFLNGMGVPLDYEAYLDLMDREKIPESLRNQLDQTAQGSNAYQIYRNRSQYADLYRRSQFSARSQEDKVPPSPVIQIKPQYPRYLREMGIDGEVTISMVIDTEGAILAPTVSKSTHSGFEEPALRALEHWKFLPGLKNGKPVEVRTHLPMIFHVN